MERPCGSGEDTEGRRGKLDRELVRILVLPDVKQRMIDFTLVAQSSAPEQLAQLLDSDIKKWAEVIERAKRQKQ